MLSHAAAAREYFVGGPVHQHDMEIVANYLVGVEMAPMMPGMAHGADVIHLEADVHATADNVLRLPGRRLGALPHRRLPPGEARQRLARRPAR